MGFVDLRVVEILSPFHLATGRVGKRRAQSSHSSPCDTGRGHKGARGRDRGPGTSPERALSEAPTWEGDGDLDWEMHEHGHMLSSNQ